jgi:putative endonuclease
MIHYKAAPAAHTRNSTMNEEERTLKVEPAPIWYVYMVCCKDNSYYTGITTDLSRRIEEHNSPKKGARYTRTRRPVELVYFENAASRAIATRRECQIKKLTPAGKKQLTGTSWPARLPGVISQS